MKEKADRILMVILNIGRMISTAGLSIALAIGVQTSIHEMRGQDHDDVIRMKEKAQTTDQRLEVLENLAHQRDEKIGRIDERSASTHTMVMWLTFGFLGMAIKELRPWLFGGARKKRHIDDDDEDSDESEE